MPFDLKVNRTELIDGVAMLRKLAKPSKQSRAFLTHDQGNLIIDVMGATARVSAEGVWSGKVNIVS